MKVVCVSVSGCPVCHDYYALTGQPHGLRDEELLTTGRYYTVSQEHSYGRVGEPQGVCYSLWEIPLPEGFGFCSCGFRPVEGDSEAWKRLLRENLPKSIPVLEPA